MRIFTSSWFTTLPPAILRIGISRAVPRGQPPGFRRIRSLEPGSWFRSVTPERYQQLYAGQLARLDAGGIVDEITRMAAGRDAALLCFEAPRDPGAWCHRGFVSAWLKDELGLDVHEYGLEDHGAGWEHPKLPGALRTHVTSE